MPSQAQPRHYVVILRVGVRQPAPNAAWADASRSPLTPARIDLDALSAQGATPTVRAFALCLAPGGRLVYEVLNENDPAAVAALNVALDRVVFDVDDVHSGTGSRHGTVPAVAVLHAVYLGRIGHDERWADSLRELLDPAH